MYLHHTTTHRPAAVIKAEARPAGASRIDATSHLPAAVTIDVHHADGSGVYLVLEPAEAARLLASLGDAVAALQVPA